MLITENCVGTIAGMYADTLRGKIPPILFQNAFVYAEKIVQKPRRFPQCRVRAMFIPPTWAEHLSRANPRSVANVLR